MLAAGLGTAPQAHAQDPAGVTVSGLAFVDDNNSGARDAGEISVAGVEVFIRAGIEGLSAITDATGRYEITNVPPGNYAIETPLDSPTRTTFANVAGDPRFNIDIGDLYGRIVVEQRDIENFDIGFAELPDQLTATPPVTDPQPPPAPVAIQGGLGAVSGRAFIDHNRNDVRDPNETGVSGLTISLVTGIDGYDDAAVAQTVTTGFDGTYEFDQVVPGRYVLRYRAQSWGPISINSGNDDTIDSDFYTSTTHSFVVNANETIANLDAGFSDAPELSGNSPATVSGMAFLDANANGLRDAGEQALAGVPFKFSLEGSSFDALIATGGDGTYYTGLVPGLYQLGGDALENTPVTVPLRGLDRRFDSNLTPYQVRITSAQVLTHFDAGFLEIPNGATVVAAPAQPPAPPAPPAPQAGELGAIGGSIQTSGFGFRSGVPFELFRYTDPAGPEELVATDTSDEVGQWGFAGLVPGFYQVRFDLPGSAPEVRSNESLEGTDFYPSQTVIFPLYAGDTVRLRSYLSDTSLPPEAFGDADCSGQVESADVDWVLRYRVGLAEILGCFPEFDLIDLPRADINGDGDLTVLDALQIAQRLAATSEVATG